MSSPNSFTLPIEHIGTNQHHQQQSVTEPTTPRQVDIVEELRSATQEISNQISAHLSARLDGFNLRLGDMERQHRLQQSQPSSPSPNARTLPSSSLNTLATDPSSTDSARTDPTEAPPANLTIHRGAHRVRLDAPVPPHMTRAAAALATSVPPPAPRPSSSTAPSDALDPLGRYQSLTKGEKTNIRRALSSLGLNMATLVSIMSTSGDDVDGASAIGSVNESASSSSIHSTSPLQVSTVAAMASSTATSTNHASAAHDLPSLVSAPATPTVLLTTSPLAESHPSSATPPTSTPMLRIDPAPNISTATASPIPVSTSTRTMTCKTEWIGEYDGDPTQLEDFLTRLRDLIRSETQAELVPVWITAVLRTLPRTLKGNAAIWHQGLSDTDAARLTSFDAWCAAMRDAFPVNRQQLKRDAWTRRWKTTEETAMGYYFHKVRLLRQTFGKDAPEETLVSDIKDGLPESMVALLRLPRKGATLTELVTELGEWEPNWRKQYKVPLHSNTTATTASSTATAIAFNTPAPAITPAARVLQQTMG
ncbi:hypothetical protein A4X13_0g9147 [Tilletia indica]|uniref:Uncharacterized protein n=1 Tax=Tilletia indica TaxID=43049 RepID=A0A177TTK5_9BASI|nr:hypothetical protein A4X13_0g9147 [Tilletia indica]